MRRNVLILGMLLISAFLVMGSANASLIIDYGVPIEIVDGDGRGVSVSAFNTTDSAYTPGYYLNGRSRWQAFAVGDSFVDGDRLRLALWHAISGYHDLGNITEMTFTGIAGYDYYQSLNTQWDIPSFTVTFSTSRGTSPDGIAPTPNPEPATLLLLGSGIVGLMVTRRKREERHKKP